MKLIFNDMRAFKKGMKKLFVFYGFFKKREPSIFVVQY